LTKTKENDSLEGAAGNGVYPAIGIFGLSPTAADNDPVALRQI
jgi:hypothetical protein